jgi:hypothetical protein
MRRIAPASSHCVRGGLAYAQRCAARVPRDGSPPLRDPRETGMSSMLARLTLPGVTLVALFALARVEAAPVALVTDVVGDAHQAGEPLALLAELEPGRELALAAGATVVVFYLGDGSEWTLRGAGRYRLAAKAPEAIGPETPPAQRRPGPPAYRDIKLRAERVQQGGLVMRAGTFEEPMALVSPAKGETVLSSDVHFRWKPLEHASGYQFELVDGAGQKLLVADTGESELPLPLAVQLRPGQTYYWAVRSRATGAAQPLYRVAEFRLVDAATRRRLDAARPRPDAPFSERVLFIALLEDVGAKSEAAQQRVRLAAERPVAWSASK